VKKKICKCGHSEGSHDNGNECYYNDYPSGSTGCVCPKFVTRLEDTSLSDLLDLNKLPRLWLHDEEMVRANKDEFLKILKKQLRQVRPGRLKVPVAPDCACCGRKSKDYFLESDWNSVYRCFQCRLYFCESCAKDHFPEVERS
jgi:hypothetical protein